MARVVLGVVGAVVGGYFGGSTGAQVGWMIGSTIGGMFDPPLQGPRLSDLQVQVSSYGSAIPITYGGDRIAGNVIWCTDLVEHSETTSGKGGPQVENHTYTVSCAIAVNGRQIGGIRRIWADAKLIYDISETADGAAHAGSQLIASLMTVYLGTEDQLPDPTIEAHEGVGNVEAFRGVAYVVFRDLPLADYGNRLPQFTFELTDGAITTSGAEFYKAEAVGPWSIDDAGYPEHFGGPMLIGTASISDPSTFPIGTTPITGTWSSWTDALAAVQAVVGADYKHVLFYESSVNNIPSGATGGAALDEEPETITVYIGSAPTVAFIPAPGDVASALAAASIAVETPGLDYPWAAYTIYSPTSGAPLYQVRQTHNIAQSSVTLGHFTAVLANQGHYPPIYPVNMSGGYFAQIIAAPVVTVTVRREAFLPATSCQPGDPCLLGTAQIPGSPGFCISCDGTISVNYAYTPHTGTFKQLTAVTYAGGALVKNGLGPVLAPTDPHYSDSAFWIAAAAAAGVGGVYGVDYPVTVTVAGKATDTTSAAEAGAMPLSAIVSDICLRSGLTADEIDVTGLVGMVPGYTLTRQTTGRANLEPLARAYRFCGIESGRKIRFQHFDTEPLATLGPDDLGATTDGQVVPLIKRMRAQEAELPAVINVAYKARSADYQAGTQSAPRSTVGSQLVVGVEIPIVLADQTAADIAARLLYEAWAGRVTNECSTLRAQAKFEAGDVVTLDDGERVHKVIFTEKNEDGQLILWKGHDITPAVALSKGMVSPVSGGGSSVRFDGPTKLVPLDVPLLRAVDDGPSLLLAAAGYRASWRGGRAYESFDGSIYNTLAELSMAATIGYATNVLAVWGGGNTVDEASELIVRLHSGELAGITRDEMLGGGNAFAVGVDGRWEILQAQRAVLVADNTYRLTGMLRGRLGTEQHMGSHAVDDLVVALEVAKLVRASQLATDIGLAASLKGVSFGVAAADVPAQPFTYHGVNLTPLSPALLAVVALPGGTYLSKWRRRSRQAVPWLSTSELPLAEASEQYLVTVLNGGAIVEQQTVSAQLATLGIPAGSYVLTQTQELAQPAFCLQAHGALMVGVNVDYRVTGSTHHAVAFDAAGAVSSQSAALGDQVLQVAHGTGAVYVLAYFLSGSVYADTTIYRLDSSNVAATPVTNASAIPGDYQGVAFDGTYVWVTKKSTGDLLKLDASTLSLVSTYAVSSPGTDGLGNLFYSDGYLWVITNQKTVVKIDPSTGGEVGRFNRGNRAIDLAVIGGVLFLSYGVYWSSGSVGGTNFFIDAIDPGTFALLGTVNDAGGQFVGSNLVQIGSLLAVPGVTGIKLIDPSSYAVIAALGDTTPYAVAGVRGSELLLTWSPSHSYLSQVTRAYTLGAPTTPPNYSGYTLRVQQVSATVGPGFPAETTIP